jgi:dipeptidyl aminopeptidase/acylaminoacyl peptidase
MQALCRALLLSFALCMLAYVGCFAAEPPASPQPLSDFFDNPGFGAARLSPDARHLAVVVNDSKGRDRLAVIELATLTPKVVAQFRDADVDDFQWVNSRRLVYDSRDKYLGPGERRDAPGLYAVDRDGANYKRLVDTSGSRIGEIKLASHILPWNTFMLGQRGSQDSDAIYVLSPKHERGEVRYSDLLRLDTVTGRATAVKRPGETHHWLLDARGEPRLATSIEGDQQLIHYLDPAGGAWRKLASGHIVEGGPGAFEPVGFAPDGTLYVISRSGDKNVLSTYDLAANRVSREPLLRLQDVDFTGELIVTSDKLLGVRYLNDARATVWFDTSMKAVQEAVDKLLPDTVNLIDVALRAETAFVLVQSYSDRQPKILYLYDTASGKLSQIGRSMPHIDPARMAPQDLVRYQARDGLTIPAWLSVPPGAKGRKLPLVVLVHGGPYRRGDEWGWDADVQFLASRGYAVLAPEFRGSTGFGDAHFRAGWKQWGLKMQDDIADGARWAVAQGIADPKRICIMGASYGGYAALMGPVRDPGLYRCAIDYVGVTDLELLYNGHWSAKSDLTDTVRSYGLPLLIGDPARDADQFAATSPLRQAAKIQVPLLLAYGGVDKRVPVYHGRKFYEAVKQTNKDVEWVVYDDEAHGWSLVSTRLDFWGRVEKFLQRQIGN